MVKYLLKKSYQLKDLKEIEFKDLWNTHGVFTTMWIFGKPAKILFFKKHIKMINKNFNKLFHNADYIAKKLNIDLIVVKIRTTELPFNPFATR